MRSDVLDIIGSAKDVTNAVVLTHNIDFVFVQSVVLSAFRRCGHPTITIFADAACAAESFAHQAPLLDGLGVRYRVVPVAMDPGFRFHPKAVLLSGETTATLLVGSGNLTFGGWRENAEVWLRFDNDRDGTAPFRTFRSFLDEVMGRVALPNAVEAEVEEAFDPKTKGWSTAEPIGPGSLLGRTGSGPPLLERMLDVVGDEPIDELVVCTPYFDNDGDALQQLVAKAHANRTTVLCQPERSTLTERAWKATSGRADLRHADFIRVGASGEERSAFVHAKFFAFRRRDQIIILAGSANCSRAALTLRGTSGNAELEAVQVLTPSEFEEAYLGELNLTFEPVALRDDQSVEPDDGDLAASGLRILAARFEARNLLVAYAPPAAAIVECVVDDLAAPFISVEKGLVCVSCATEPRLVAVRGRVNGESIESAPAWIDHEHHLRATARGRSLADSFRARVQPGEWNASAWAEVLDVFCKHLSYMPAHRSGSSSPGDAGLSHPADQPEFTASDAFSPSYQAPRLGSLRIPGALAGSEHVQSLQQLLLRWFGAKPGEVNPEGGSTGEDNAEGDGDVVDSPESLTVPLSLPGAANVTDRDRRRIATLLSQIEVAMTSGEFLAERGPEQLAADLKVTSALLCLGLREGWVERKRFFEVTQRVWSSLFFSSAARTVGWLEYRARSADDQSIFVNDMRSPELSAALIGWKLAAASNDGTPEAARFALAAVLAVARLPWLWHGGEPNQIAEELAVFLSHVADTGLSRDELVSRAEAEWNLLLRRGHALRRLEASVSSMTPAEIRERIRIDDLQPGDLLWQGSAGFCVVRQQCSRAADPKATVLRLQGDGSETQFLASFTVPIRALLDEDVIPRTDDFADEPRSVLRELIDELSKGFAQ